MTGPMKPCLDCGELSTNTRCDDCRRERDRTQARAGYAKRGPRERKAGHSDASWQRLSKLARKRQPFCSDCGRSASDLEPHERLEVDHPPSAWLKVELKKPILLTDVQVLCSTHNNQKGSSRPGSQRWNEWLAENPRERESYENRNRSPQS